MGLIQNVNRGVGRKALAAENYSPISVLQTCVSQFCPTYQIETVLPENGVISQCRANKKWPEAFAPGLGTKPVVVTAIGDTE